MVKKRKSWLVFIYVLLVLICFYPYEFYSTYFLFIPNEATYLTAFLALVTGVLFLFNQRRFRSSITILVVFIQFVGFVLVTMAHGGGNITSPLIRMILALLLVFLIESSEGGLVGFFVKYNWWILLMAVLGTIAWALQLFVGLSPLQSFVERAGGLTMYNYGLTFTKSDLMNSGMIRYAGFFDEPGAMAYWGLYALLINKLYIKDNRLELILSISLLFTFSLGYYIQLVVYLLFFSSGHNKRSTRFILVIISVFVVIAITRLDLDSDLYKSSIGRVAEAMSESQENEDVFMADNRAGYAENAKAQFLNNPLFGSSLGEDMGNNIYENLARYGIIGCLFILFPYLCIFIISIKYKEWDLLKCGIIILLGFSHRPFHNALLYYFIMYSIITMYYVNKKKAYIPTANVQKM